MYHFYISFFVYFRVNFTIQDKTPPSSAAFYSKELLLCVLALLISDTAACLACRLAGCLALAASTVLCAVTKVLCIDRLDVLHN
jgi:hypothetical protein